MPKKQEFITAKGPPKTVKPRGPLREARIGTSVPVADVFAKTCGAELPDGSVCEQPAPLGHSRCPAHAVMVGGRYGASLKGRMRDAYDRSRVDPRLLTLDDELALLDATTTSLAERMSELDEMAGEGQLPLMLRDELTRLRRDVAALVERRAKLVEVSARISGLLTPEEVAEFGQRLVTLVLRHVPELDRRQAIARDFEGLVIGDASVYARLPLSSAWQGEGS